MVVDENVAAADNGSPGEKKHRALSEFFHNYNDMILQLEPRFVNEQTKQSRQSSSPVINRTITGLEQALLLPANDGMAIYLSRYKNGAHEEILEDTNT